MTAPSRLAFATVLALTIAFPALAQQKPAAPARPASPEKVVKLPTAVDGEVFYHFDPATNLPINAGDDRARVTAVALSFLPKKKGEDLKWNFYYSLQFAKGAPAPKFITVWDESNKPLRLEVGDKKPSVEGGTWSANSQPHAVDKKTWDSMIGPKTWYLQRKFIIEYADGTERSLHQMSVVTQQMRLELLQKVTGMQLLQPAQAPAPAAAPTPAKQ
jgi:hypothetical protein